LKFRKLSILVVALMLTVALAACGDSPTATSAPATTAAATATKAATTAAATTAAASGTTADLPAFPGATVVALPAGVESQFSTSVGSSLKNAKVVAYKVPTDIPTQKNSLPKAFSDAGWGDASSLIPATTFSSMEAAGAFGQAYLKGTKVAITIGFPGSLMAAAVPGVTATDSLFILFTGEANA
jgi:hypothetical protein